MSMTKTKGVVYFTCGSSHWERLIVSLHSLRRQEPEIPVTILMVDDGLAHLDYLKLAQTRYNSNIVTIPKKEGYGALAHKISSLRHTPYDVSFFLDADTIIVSPLEEAFVKLKDSGKDFAFVNFAGWRSDGKQIRKRIERFRGILPDQIVSAALEFGDAINVGTFLYKRNSSFLEEWEKGTIEGQRAKVFIPDEIYAQVCLPRLNPLILGPEWGVSVRYGNMAGAKIVHYHGDKHDGNWPLCSLWRQCRDEAGLSKAGDNTLVVAVDSAYWDTFLNSKQTWDSCGLLSKFPSLLLHDGSLSKKQVRESGFDTVRSFSVPKAETQRELMLSSFVMVAPFEVETPFWTKLDADCRTLPKTRLFESPCWRNFDIVSHKWGYTKPARWVSELESWRKKVGIGAQFITDERLAETIGDRTFKSQRFQSFACFHNTASTRLMAAPALAEGRLPVPSHDTYFWFMAEALGMKIKTVNLKGWGFRH